ncbi:hypothetical protein N7475_003763 [Penicillium sp. IBT 31633x]|nr:hypothetical protein N7475_003763 [Penicillium sp. IBT 31633x]
MTSSKTFTPTSEPLGPRPRGASTPRPQARSAGTAERPSRNEGLVDMVRFFQTQNMSSIPQPSSQPEHQSHSRTHSQPPPSSPSDTTTALPQAMSPKIPKPEPKQDLKPFHRRLLQFAQRQKRESSPRSKEEEQQRRIDALTREGYLIAPRAPKEPKGQKEAKRSKESVSSSLSRSLSKSKKDVENIGQPWLQAKADDRMRSVDPRRRLGSLDLDDFSSMVDVAVSLTAEFDDSMPPPYQPSDNAPSQPSSAVPMSNSMTDPSPQNIARSASTLASPRPSFRNASIDDQIQRPSSSAEPNVRGVLHNAACAPRDLTNAPANVNGAESLPRSSTDSQKRDHSNQSSARSLTPSQPTLKLFPDVAPPRKSSMAALRTSAIPRYQMIDSNISSPASSSRPTLETPNEPRKSSDVLIGTPPSQVEPKCSGALAPSGSSAATLSEDKTPKESTPDDSANSQPASLTLGTLKAFPLPAPTRPLPSLPEIEGLPSAPQEANARSLRSARSEPVASSLKSSSASILEDQEIGSAVGSPSPSEYRPATALDSIDVGESMTDDEESLFAPSLLGHSKRTPGLCDPRPRVSSVRIPRMQELQKSPSGPGDNQASEGQPLADSPVLGHSTLSDPYGKATVLKGLQIDAQASQKNMPFGLPSPPPTASLPSAPPPQHAPPPPPPPGRNISQRNYTSPNVSMLSSMRSMDALSSSGSYRNSTISRSDSSGSSLRHESFPESYQQLQTHPESRPESPLPSSDDEVFGPESNAKSSIRKSDKYQRVQPTRRGHGMVDTRQTPQNRLRYPQSTRPKSPRSRSIHSLERASSPQSQYSHSTNRSRESQGSQQNRAARQIDHYLEDRVANLERQNQLLQAALLAALNAGVKNPLEGLNHLDPNLSPAFSHAPYTSQYSGRHASRPDSWVSSSRGSEHSGFESSSSYRDGRANVKQLDNMIEDIESGWLSDKSSHSGTRLARKR